MNFMGQGGTDRKGCVETNVPKKGEATLGSKKRGEAKNIKVPGIN